MSGPSATAKPMAAKIAVSSSVTCVIGCTRPSSAGASRTGRVTSTVSVLSRASSAAVFSASRRAAMAVVMRSLSPLIAGPCALRSSGVMPPSVLSSADTEPLLPSAATRTASSAVSSAAAAMALVSSLSSLPMSDILAGALRRQRGLGLFHDRLERRRLADGEVGEHFAIDQYAGLEPLDPQRAEGALAPLAVTEGVLAGLLHRLLGDADRVLAAAVIALGGLENFLVLGVRGDTTFDAGHERSPLSFETERWMRRAAV